MPLSDINPGSALTAIDSNDAPLLEFRVKRSGTITPLGVIESIAHETSGDLLKGRLALLTNNGTTTTPQMLIDEEGNVGIGTLDPRAKLHVEGNALLKGPLKIGEDPSGGAALSVDGNVLVKGKVNATSLHVEGEATFKGPLTTHEAVTVPSLSVRGAVGIGGNLSVGGDVVVAGKLKAASIESDGGTLSNVSLGFEQLNDRIDKQNKRLSDLESLPRKEFLDFTPQLDGDWVGGTTSPEFVIGGEGAQVTATGNMSVDLPDLSKIVMFQYSCEFIVRIEFVPQLIVRLRRRKIGNASDEVTIVELINDQQDTIVAGFPNLETHLVQTDFFEYFIQADVNFFSAGAAAIPKGLVVLTEFSVLCIAGDV